MFHRRDKPEKIFCIFAIGLLFLALAPPEVFPQIVIVVPNSSSIDSLSTPELKKIFKGERVGSPREIPVQIVEFAPLRSQFYQHLYGLGSYAMAKHWLRLILSGERVLSPKSISGATKLYAYLRKHENSVGFLPLEKFLADKPQDIRAVVIDGRSFTHPDYFFRQKR